MSTPKSIVVDGVEYVPKKVPKVVKPNYGVFHNLKKGDKFLYARNIWHETFMVCMMEDKFHLICIDAGPKPRSDGIVNRILNGQPLGYWTKGFKATSTEEELAKNLYSKELAVISWWEKIS